MRINIDLCNDSLDKSIKELKDYKKTLIEKLDKVLDRVAEDIAILAQERFDNSVVEEDLISKTSRKAEVKVIVEKSDNSRRIVALGEDAIFVEFGAGVYYNTPTGSSKHPKGNELGFTIGSYGKGRGSKEVWGYYPLDDKKNELVLTHGTESTMPLYLSAEDILSDLGKIIKEVFNND